GDTQRGAKYARTIEYAGRGKLAQPRRELLVHEADVPEEHGESNEGATRMIHGDESGISDDIERLLAAVIGVRPPADIREQTCHVTQSPLLCGLFQAGRRHEAVGPGDQLLAMGGR